MTENVRLGHNISQCHVLVISLTTYFFGSVGSTELGSHMQNDERGCAGPWPVGSFTIGVGCVLVPLKHQATNPFGGHVTLYVLSSTKKIQIQHSSLLPMNLDGAWDGDSFGVV